MDYGKGGNPKSPKDRHQAPGIAPRGAPKADDRAAAKKAELLERMKAATKSDD